MQGRICVMTVFDVAVIRHRRNHIASAAFSALLEDRLVRLRMHYNYLYNRIRFYLASSVADKVFSHIFRKKSTCHYLDFVI